MDQASTKSIDVGGIFLMDLSVNESDTTNHIDYQQSADRMKTENRPEAAEYCSYRNNAGQIAYSNNGRKAHNYINNHNHDHQIATNSVDTGKVGGDYQPTKQLEHHIRANNSIYRQPDYLGTSLDRLASVINGEHKHQQQREMTFSSANSSNNIMNDDENEQMVTMLGVKQSHALKQNQQRYFNLNSETQQPERSSFSFSDESFAASSDASLSASFTGCSEEDEQEEDARDRDSTTTREDSGVLDMKDLEVRLNGGCNSFEERNQTSLVDQYSANHHHHSPSSSNRPISVSTNIMTKNLISSNKETTTNNFDDDYHNNNEMAAKNPQQQQQHSHRSSAKQPTDGNGISSNNDEQLSRSSHSNNNNNNHYHHHYHHQNYNNHHVHQHRIGAGPRLRVSASVPIQVPARQMRKDLNKMKLNLLKEEQTMEQELALGLQDAATTAQEIIIANTNSNTKNQNLAIFEDDDTFLEQEYNTNHHNHYSINEHSDENLTAGDDPMKLFASIQALARSLHEDSEIFGSLPPKRTLESPVRTMALV